MIEALEPQPDPAHGFGDIWGDLLPRLPERLRPYAAERRRQGIERYGVTLSPFNGRDARMDLFQELLDGIAYAEQAVVEGRENYGSVRDNLIALAYAVAGDLHPPSGAQ